MKHISLLLIGATFALISCEAEEPLTLTEECLLEERIDSKEAAKSAIIGEWHWVKTTYNLRGTAPRVETPAQEGKKLIYRFTNNRLFVIENSNLVEELRYDIRFAGEGTNTVDPVLTIVFQKLNGTYTDRSMLALDKNTTCMQLINSYDDGGGDLSFKKADL